MPLPKASGSSETTFLLPIPADAQTPALCGLWSCVFYNAVLLLLSRGSDGLHFCAHLLPDLLTCVGNRTARTRAHTCTYVHTHLYTCAHPTIQCTHVHTHTTRAHTCAHMQCTHMHTYTRVHTHRAHTHTLFKALVPHNLGAFLESSTHPHSVTQSCPFYHL